MAGADPGFLVGGGARPPGRGANIQIFQIFPKKLHEIKKILVWGAPPRIRHCMGWRSVLVFPISRSVIIFFTARKRRYRNVFTGLRCLSVNGEEGGGGLGDGGSLYDVTSSLAAWAYVPSRGSLSLVPCSSWWGWGEFCPVGVPVRETPIW